MQGSRELSLPNGLYTCFEGTSSFPLLRGSRFLHFSFLFCIFSTLPPPSTACNSYRTLFPPGSPVRSFPYSFFRRPASPSASEESSRPSHVRGNPANFDEFPRNELKETGAGGRERWTRFGRIVTYDAREDGEDDDDGVGTYRTGLIAREAANRSEKLRELRKF